MNTINKTVTLLTIIAVLVSCFGFTAFATQDINLDIKSESALLMEASTGKILYEKNSQKKLPPASVTKVMSLLIIMDALDSGKIKEDDVVTASEFASSMGGSQIYLEPGEKMTVRNLLKAIAISSANDATVAMAEFIAGSERRFVKMMNKKAEELGMKDTVFYNTTGLDDEEPYNLTTAHDVAIMSRELTKYPKIFEYTTIWIDSLRDGEFGLANTNKLIRFYSGANGLKTGYTKKAQYCLSATAKRDNLQLIAVVMKGPTSKDRFGDAKRLLNYGFANYSCVLLANKGEVVSQISVSKGVCPKVDAIVQEDIKILVKRGNKHKITSKLDIPKHLSAPLKKGDKIGEIVYKVKDKEVGRFKLVASKDVSKINVFNAFKRILSVWLTI